MCARFQEPKILEVGRHLSNKPITVVGTADLMGLPSLTARGKLKQRKSTAVICGLHLRGLGYEKVSF